MRLGQITALHPDLLPLNMALVDGNRTRAELAGILHQLADKLAKGGADRLRIEAAIPHRDADLNALLNAIAKAAPLLDQTPWAADELEDAVEDVEGAAQAYIDKARDLIRNLNDPHSR